MSQQPPAYEGDYPTPFALGAGHGLLISFWQMRAGAREADARLAGGLYVDTSRWPERGTPLEKYRRAVAWVHNVYEFAQQHVDHERLHPLDLTNPIVIAWLMAQQHMLDCTPDEWPAFAAPLSPAQVRATRLYPDALCLQVQMREGDVPALWWMSCFDPAGRELFPCVRLGYQRPKGVRHTQSTSPFTGANLDVRAARGAAGGAVALDDAPYPPAPYLTDLDPALAQRLEALRDLYLRGQKD